MAVIIPFLILNALCSMFEFPCDFLKKEAVNLAGFHLKRVMGPVSQLDGTAHNFTKVSRVGRVYEMNDGRGRAPVVHTKSGTIQGFRVKLGESREYKAFTGVPYGETPIRFQAPVKKKPWPGVLHATSPSPFCIHFNRGTEDCLYLDVYSPRVSPRALLPVIIAIPAGGYVFGRSREYGPTHFMREDVVLVVPNYRLGVYGFLSTGDSASPGNWGLKDISLAVEWTYHNVRGFGGDPERIVVAGISAGGISSHLMLFTKHKIRDYIKGVIALSGSAFMNAGLDSRGVVQRSSDLIARTAGCPTSAEGRSQEMVKCLGKMDPYVLGALQYMGYRNPPFILNMLSPTIEPDLPGAFITTLPEVQYEQGLVPKIPLITTRTEDETSLVLSVVRLSRTVVNYDWREWMPALIGNLGYRTHSTEKMVSKKEILSSLDKVTRFYFNSTKTPRIWRSNVFPSFVKLADDMMFNAGHLKAVRLHHKLAPTYSYIVRSNFFVTQMHPLAAAADRTILGNFKSSHAAEFPLLFSDLLPVAKPGTPANVTSSTLVNFIVNFAKFGEPLYRTAEGKLVSFWKPITDMQEPWTLSLGLGNISTIKDPLVGSERIKIWDTVTF